MIKNFKLLIFATTLLAVVSCASEPNVVTPPSEKLEQWADMEMGVLFHYDIFTYQQDYKWSDFGEAPDPSIFNPSALNTDQWIETIAKMGAKYAILTAKHCSGFCLWPTKAHDYNISKSPWKNGEGDVVADFVNSCRKYGVKPSVYCSATANGYFKVGDDGVVRPGSPTTQQEYPRIVEKQYEELWSNYGDLFEVWFDGGVIPVEQGGPDVYGLLCRCQPDAIGFQAPKTFANRVRWVGNEIGEAPDPCWATDTKIDENGRSDSYNGQPFASDWNPGETDFPLRYGSNSGGWFWDNDNQHKMLTAEQLVEKYEHSVGRNTNMLLGIVIDDRGLVPAEDSAVVCHFRELLDEKYGNPEKSIDGTGKEMTLSLDTPKLIDRAVIQEDIHYGERILEYSIQGLTEDGVWTELYSGTNVGHKRIASFQPTMCSTVRLVVNSQKATPRIRNFSIYSAN